MVYTGSIKIGFTGDIALSQYFYDNFLNQNDDFFNNMSCVWDDCDFVAGNFEGTLIPDTPSFKYKQAKLQSPEPILNAFSGTPFKVFTCANNHILDSGHEALNFTVESLNKRGFLTFGAGTTKHEANAGQFQKIYDYRIAWIAGCEFFYAHAVRNKSGSADYSKKRLLKSIKIAQNTSDLIIVVLHTDFEFRDHPDPARQKLCRSLIDAGANIVICHHPHVWQGIEQYSDGLIAYSIGNFLFAIGDYQKKHSGVMETGLLKININFSGLKTPDFSWSVAPLRLNDRFYPVPVNDDMAKKWVHRLNLLSEELLDKSKLQSAWADTSKKEFREIIYGLYYCMCNRGLRPLIKRLIHVCSESLTWRALIGVCSKGKL